MRKYLLLLSTLVLSACVGNNADSFIQKREQSANDENRAFANSQDEINRNCGSGGIKNVPRKGAGKYGKCVANIYAQNVLPVTIFPNEFQEFLGKYQDIFDEFERGKISRSAMIAKKDHLVAAYLQLRADITDAKLAELQSEDRIEREQMRALTQSVSDYSKQQDEQWRKSMPVQSHCVMFGNTARCTTY